MDIAGLYTSFLRIGLVKPLSYVSSWVQTAYVTNFCKHSITTIKSKCLSITTTKSKKYLIQTPRVSSLTGRLGMSKVKVPSMTRKNVAQKLRPWNWLS